MAKALTEAEITQMKCFALMSAWNFTYNRRREWVIWGARHRVCPTCGAQTYKPCLNLSDRRQGRPERTNRQPHDARVDWNRILGGLKLRGYWNQAVITQVTHQIGRRGKR